MRISQLYQTKLPVSFEMFPPKGDMQISDFYSTLDHLSDLSPDFISVTYSAGGGGNSEKTLELSSIVKNRYNIETAAHLTCINSSIEEIDTAIEQLKKNNIENILALRGDRIEGKEPKDFKYAYELISYLRDKGFCIGAGCYPEGHIESDTLEKDIEYLKMKQDAGAEFFISQLFYDNNRFYRFIEKIRAAGITNPVDAGIMPILSKTSVSRMIFMCGVSLPSEIVKLLYKYESSPDDLRKAGIEYAAEQISDLLSNGVDGIHIYTMNRPEVAKRHMEKIKDAGFRKT